ncbi:MAG TPA: zinc ribbon domain-containing protein [Blastocatellia bacterium]|nr:zinc ribbon domain-containing protein [Blastocatellia bacterium]
MYCPSCSSHNQDDVRFCTRCGANLGVVSDALSGKLVVQSQIDERLVKLFKDYYRGRNSMIIGAAASLIALFKVVLFALVGIPTRVNFLSTLAAMLLVYGFAALIWGAARWNNSASEIKAIERASSLGPLKSAGNQPGLLSGEAAAIRSGSLSAESVTFPGSATEHTTRQLDERGYAPVPEPEQERNR